MALKLTVDVDAEEALKHLGEMAFRARHFEPVFLRAKRTLERANAENFALGGLPVGGWEARKRDYAWPILRRTGKLADSLGRLSGPPNVITDEYAEFGTSVEYAQFHQNGIRTGFDRDGNRKGMPSRQIVFEPRGFSKDLADEAASYIVRGLREELY